TENGDIIFKEPDATTTAPTTTANPIATGDIIITENGEIIIGGEIPDEISYRAATPRANTAKKTQEPAAITYKVKKGDSYWSIARNANTTVATLLKLNNLTEKSVMQPGMTLLLPAKK
ncbi:MAG TPA: LysM domain-containing protein, partial [Chitinophagales bacterium]|nr:LysM domain-containing protein [Chitinophagales bacterium]